MSYLHDASPTWNGFNYQGKIALIAVLDKMLELALAGESIDEYSLELEWLEDFSIKKGTDYVSIHQVKNYGTNNLQSYDEAIHLLLSKILTILTVNEIRVLITERIPKELKSEIAQEVHETIKAQGFIDEDNMVLMDVDTNNLVLSDETRLKVKRPDELTERTRSCINNYRKQKENCSSLAKAYMHIAEPLNDNFDLDSIKSLDLISQLKLSAENGGDEAIGKCELFEYSDGLYNCLDTEIDVQIKTRIKDCLTQIKVITDDYKTNDQYLEKLRIQLLDIIDKHVVARHQSIRLKESNPNREISFQSFDHSLESNPDENLELDVYMLREQFETVLKLFLQEIAGESDKCMTILNLTDNIYRQYPGNEFLEFCQKIAPQSATIEINQSLLDHSGLRDSFFQFFYVASTNMEEIYVKDANTGDYGIVTTINENNFDRESRKKIVYEQIKKNRATIHLNFNIQRLIGNVGIGNGGQSCSEIISKATSSPEQNNGNKPRRSDKFTISDDFTVVDIIEEINRINEAN